MKLPLFIYIISTVTGKISKVIGKMGIHAIAKKAREINQNIDLLVVQAVKNKEKALVDINRSQMLNHKTSEGRDFVNIVTGKKKLSASYAAQTGKIYPNLKLTGDFQKDMFLETKGDEFFISSIDGKTLKLISWYSEKIFGIMPKNRPKAKQISVRELSRIYYKKLLGA